MRRMLPMMVVLLLGAAACGGSSDDSAADGGDQPAATSAAADDGASDATTSPPADDGGGGDDDAGTGPSTATVTVGDQTYDFSTERAPVAQCLTDLFGIFSVQLPTVDGDGSIQIMVLHDDTDPSVVEQLNAVRVDVGDDTWVADEASDLFDMSDQLEPGMSQVDSAEIDGSTVRGTATFVRQSSVFGGELETVAGTFEATCGEERTA